MRDHRFDVFLQNTQHTTDETQKSIIGLEVTS